MGRRARPHPASASPTRPHRHASRAPRSPQCAGYPEGHPDRIKPAADLGRPLSAAEKGRAVDIDGVEHVCSDADMEIEYTYLKEKCDAGSDVIITQLFYDMRVFETFVAECRARGIHAPILPGVMPLGAYGGFKRMTGFCKTRIPPEMAEVARMREPTPPRARACLARRAATRRGARAQVINKLKDDAQKEDFVEFGLQYVHALCDELLRSKLVPGAARNAEPLLAPLLSHPLLSLSLSLSSSPPPPSQAPPPPAAGLHFYSLNSSERTFELLKRLGYLRPT